MKKRILLAEDDESVRRMIGRVLESEDYEVLLAQDVPDAVAKAAAHNPDLVLLDIGLAGGNGSATEFMRQLSAPIVLLTDRSHFRRNPLPSPAAVALEKPLDLVALLTIIEELLHLRPAARPS